MLQSITRLNNDIIAGKEPVHSHQVQAREGCATKKRAGSSADSHRSRLGCCCRDIGGFVSVCSKAMIHLKVTCLVVHSLQFHVKSNSIVYATFSSQTCYSIFVYLLTKHSSETI